MINVIARISVQPESTDEFETAVATARASFLADEGCLRYDLQRVARSEGDYVLLEAYDSKDALRRHGAMDEFAAFGEAIGTLVQGPPEVTVLSPVGDQVGLAL
ncbi:putative quinol monooxygenase [Janibacter terrae]|uniref:putative quinol monooxygenase n=1 Tax=Janibacter terrae TaxID=103817 RepID=UPI0031FA3EE6